jgi:hypothetical protein
LILRNSKQSRVRHNLTVNRVFELAFGRVKKFLTGRPGFANLWRLGTDRNRDRPEPAKPQQPSVADNTASRITSEFPALPGILVGPSDAEQLRCLHWPARAGTISGQDSDLAKLGAPDFHRVGDGVTHIS